MERIPLEECFIKGDYMGRRVINSDGNPVGVIKDYRDGYLILDTGFKMNTYFLEEFHVEGGEPQEPGKAGE